MVERSRNIQNVLSTSDTASARLEGIVPVTEDWHAKMCLGTYRMYSALQILLLHDWRGIVPVAEDWHAKMCLGTYRMYSALQILLLHDWRGIVPVAEDWHAKMCLYKVLLLLLRILDSSIWLGYSSNPARRKNTHIHHTHA